MNNVVHYGRTSVVLKEGQTEVYITPLGGNVTTVFNNEGKRMTPFLIAPWWDKYFSQDAMLLNTFRGNFFCFPMGGDAEGVSGTVHPGHGLCANDIWEVCESTESSLHMKYSFADITIDKNVCVKNGVVYENNIVSGAQGEYPVAYHPMFRLTDSVGETKVHVCSNGEFFSPNAYIENPENGGYTLLKLNQKSKSNILDTLYDTKVDVLAQPINRGFDDVVLITSNDEEKIGYTTLTYKNDGYVYFQFKNKQMLKHTMLWMSHDGRHYEPWNGTFGTVLGIEETTSYFHFGVKASRELNDVSKAGYATVIDMKSDERYEFKLANGVFPIDETFGHVKTVSVKNNEAIFTGSNGGEVRVEIDPDFL